MQAPTRPLTEPMKAAPRSGEAKVRWSETHGEGQGTAGHPQLRNAHFYKLRWRPYIRSCPAEVRSALLQDSAAETSLMK